MNTGVAILLLVAGLLILWKGADLLVAGAVALAERLGVSSLVVGLTVVAMGTSAPEVAARRLLAQKGIRLDGELLQDGDAPFPGPGVLQAGKRRFVRIVKG